METKKCYKQPADYQRNQIGNQKIPRDKWKWKHDHPKPLGHNKSNSRRDIYSNKILPEETKKLKQPNLTPKATRERRTKKSPSQQKKGNNIV